MKLAAPPPPRARLCGQASAAGASRTRAAARRRHPAEIQTRGGSRWNQGKRARIFECDGTRAAKVEVRT